MFRLSALLAMLATPGLAATPASVSTEFVRQAETAPSLQFTGSISVHRQALLSPRISGLVESLDLEAGDHVNAGDVVVELDPTLAEIELGLLESDLSLAQAEEEENQRLVDEANRLGDSGFPRSERLSRVTDLEQAKLAVIRVKAEIEAQKERVRRHKVVAPFSGYVADKLTEIGEWVQTGTPVINLLGDEDYRMDVRIPQERIAAALQTKSVEIEIPGLAGTKIAGKVDALGPLVDPGTRTFLVRVSIQDPPSILRAGMSAVATFYPENSGSELLIPRDAIIRKEDGSVLVWLVEQNGDETTTTSRAVELGTRHGKYMTVISGLSQGDQIVVRGNESLREGQPIRLVSSRAPSPQPNEEN